jgi:IS30 family transposase
MDEWLGMISTVEIVGFPKKTDLSVYSQTDLNKVAQRLNQRPRKTLGFETPASKLQASVASTG